MVHCRDNAGFSLVEVALALGIVVFAGFSLVGLLALGLKNSGDSKQQLEAATIAEAICSTRRAAPTLNLASTQPNFPLPALNVTTTQSNFSMPLYLTRNGTTTTLAKGDARFGLFYQIIPPASYVPSISPGVATVYLCLYWPAGVAPATPNISHFEVTTTISLP
jgi:hypothetical protein